MALFIDSAGNLEKTLQTRQVKKTINLLEYSFGVAKRRAITLDCEMVGIAGGKNKLASLTATRERVRSPTADKNLQEAGFHQQDRPTHTRAHYRSHPSLTSQPATNSLNYKLEGRCHPGPRHLYHTPPHPGSVVVHIALDRDEALSQNWDNLQEFEKNGIAVIGTKARIGLN